MKKIDRILDAIGNRKRVAIRLVSCSRAEFTQLLLVRLAGIELSRWQTGNLNSSDWMAITAAASKIAECELCYVDMGEEPQLLNYDMTIEI